MLTIVLLLAGTATAMRPRGPPKVREPPTVAARAPKRSVAKAYDSNAVDALLNLKPRGAPIPPSHYPRVTIFVELTKKHNCCACRSHEHEPCLRKIMLALSPCVAI